MDINEKLDVYLNEGNSKDFLKAVQDAARFEAQEVVQEGRFDTIIGDTMSQFEIDGYDEDELKLTVKAQQVFIKAFVKELVKRY